VSRVPRSQEHLKTGFTAEAVSAARFRAFAARAEAEGKPDLARRWLELAVEKDALAILQLDAAGQVRAAATNVADALAEERYEVEVLYPSLIAAVGVEAGAVFERVVESQRQTARELESMRDRVQASPGDI
jgi:rubrerythrin